MERTYDERFAYYRMEPGDALTLYAGGDVRELNWHADIEQIRRFYRHWTPDGIDPPGDDEPGIGAPLALIECGEIVSFAIPFAFREGETEIGAVATLEECRGRGCCRRVIGEMARRILAEGKAATLTTGRDNTAMQRTALAVGMKRVDE